MRKGTTMKKDDGNHGNLTADNRDVKGRMIVVAQRLKHWTLNQKNTGSNPVESY